jgi:hypothetical protein
MRRAGTVPPPPAVAWYPSVREDSVHAATMVTLRSIRRLSSSRTTRSGRLPSANRPGGLVQVDDEGHAGRFTSGSACHCYGMPTHGARARLSRPCTHRTPVGRGTAECGHTAQTPRGPRPATCRSRGAGWDGRTATPALPAQTRARGATTRRAGPRRHR